MKSLNPIPEILAASALFFLAGMGCRQEKPERAQPNIVYILADDLGYGDVSAYNPASAIRTPQIDKLAATGIRFTDAHASSSVCTPSRYGILTGVYCWRSSLKQGVLRGYGGSLIANGQTTAATVLKQYGYNTAAIGKWHLGLNWAIKKGHEQTLLLPEPDPEDIDFFRPVDDGPNKHGFDHSYILPASLDMPPYCYVRNDTLTAIPDEYTAGSEVREKDDPEYATGAFWRAGKMAPGFDFNQVLPHLTEQAVSYIGQQKNSEKPFFLYFAMPAPHTPWLPSAEYEGAARAGDYGDYVAMTDAMVGKVLAALEKNGLGENTIVIFSSDNGPYWRPAMTQRYNHHATGIYRGMKADIWDGGHRVPLIVRWPGHVTAGRVSNIVTSLTNLVATCSELNGGPARVPAATDSYSILPVLLGRADSADIPQMIVHASSNGMFGIRSGEWKWVEGLGSGGFSVPVTEEPRPGGPQGQLYNMRTDPSETENHCMKMPGRANALSRSLDSIKQLTVQH
ncbi:arylsulfatase [Chitinophaga sp. GCM10012297]|uniref:Arylsulfatase n=1 Tax=Chitinophaga chungangae TaxID=2821488 RepID=A0ABS3YGQ7_9BACT|nr:arylsulfatase [Chitinophaga chungangae]MBO9153473.1 arylsulfatase [Chitinophaga chungangae]